MSDTSSSSSGVGAALAKLVNWGIPKVRPKTIKAADELVRPMIRRWVALAVGVSWVPGSTFVLAGVDYKLFHDIAKIYGIPNFDVDAMFVAIGGTVVGRGAAEGAGWLFGVGWLTNPPIAGLITKKLADGIMSYMREESKLPPG
jgi:hypothetical protein